MHVGAGVCAALQTSVTALKQQLQEHLSSVQQQVQQQDVLLSGVQQQQGEVQMPCCCEA
jgi:hypothetical protein